MTKPNKSPAPRNKTLTLTPEEQQKLLTATIRLQNPVITQDIIGKIIHQDLLECLPFLPDAFIDLLIIDPPYNLTKQFGGRKFAKTTEVRYQQWLETWLPPLKRCLTPQASIYVCCDWQSSKAVQTVLEQHFIIRNRITWEREKGRGAKTNWKNCSEDIWFCTLDKAYYFDVEAVKLKRKVIAPYRHSSGKPKDWQDTDSGKYRLTHPSNLWTDISVPFWSMPENTNHPTQKPEKLIAKLILASSKPGDVVCDPFVGSGTSCVVAKKLGRQFVGIELEEEYCALALARLARADTDNRIQGYHEGCFWERNSAALSDTRNNN
jgi:site-specific DNA-methyltransferase (adenine-specific)